ncbi:hypothetical protein HYDPIDRAFT_43614 [Hydnomerulius pinastri MD-312]|uniref:WD40 repeat-like protein n=1 Tax=Hydnomerulius pinastri MD-312 TaxID=994086 RepID=A0A0C9W9Q4_9AGAM|nr:hypothetical protein HYDPIDRAFT_43614 [Hydnomerulius pinastri MD-312]
MSGAPSDPIDPAPKHLLTTSAHDYSITAIAFFPGGERFATCSYDSTPEGQLHCRYEDGKRIMSGDSDARLCVWEVETHDLLEQWTYSESEIHSIALSPNDELVASGSDDGTILIREANNGGAVGHAIETDTEVELSVYLLCFSPNRERIASASGSLTAVGHEDSTVQVFDIATGDLLGPLQGHTDHISSMLWSVDGRHIFSGSWDRTIRKWNSETGGAVGEPWRGHTRFVYSLAISPDGTRIASSSNDKTVRFWNTDSREPAEKPLRLEHGAILAAVAFSPTGEFVVTGGQNGTFYVWRIPWWDETQKQQPESEASFLDLPAVTRHPVNGFDLDFFNVTHSRRQSPESP